MARGTHPFSQWGSVSSREIDMDDNDGNESPSSPSSPVGRGRFDGVAGTGSSSTSSPISRGRFDGAKYTRGKYADVRECFFGVEVRFEPSVWMEGQPVFYSQTRSRAHLQSQICNIRVQCITSG